MGRILIVAGEASGDMHAAELVREAGKLAPDLTFHGLGGPKMEEAGAEILYDPLEHSSTGITEFFASVPRMYPYLSRLEAIAREERPLAAVLVDYPEFNLRLAKRLKRLGIPVIYYISPQFWAWRAWRVKTVKKYVDHMLVLFDFEVDFYRKFNFEVTFVGHPLVDMLSQVRPDPQFRRSLGIPDGHRLIGLLPGSRKREVRHLFGPMVRVAKIMRDDDSKLSFVVGKSPHVRASELNHDASDLPLHIVEGRSHEVMANCDFLFVASGTATLEAAVIGTPMVVAYIASTLSYHICKPLKTSKYMALVNVMAGRKIVPELLQYQANPRNLARTAQRIMATADNLDAVSRELKDTCRHLGPPGASRRAAMEILKIVGMASDN